VTGVLRFIGVLNAAVWLGGTVFFTVAAVPAVFSPEINHLLGPNNYPYFSGAIGHVLLLRCYHFQIACGIIALLHLACQWLYSRRSLRKLTVSLAIALFVLALLGANWFEPRVSQLHGTRFAAGSTAAQQERAATALRRWQVVLQILNLFTISGLTVYLWQISNPPDTTRFISSVKFRG
jgi:hypothetical protein